MSGFATFADDNVYQERHCSESNRQLNADSDYTLIIQVLPKRTPADLDLS